MKIAMLPIEDVKPYARNPRRNDGKAVEKVAASIREFGFRQPIVVDRDMVVVAGHTRLKAAQALGLKRIPVHVAADLTPAQARLYRLASPSCPSCLRGEHISPSPNQEPRTKNHEPRTKNQE